jgi:hypothetical protein
LRLRLAHSAIATYQLILEPLKSQLATWTQNRNKHVLRNNPCPQTFDQHTFCSFSSAKCTLTHFQIVLPPPAQMTIYSLLGPPPRPPAAPLPVAAASACCPMRFNPPNRGPSFPCCPAPLPGPPPRPRNDPRVDEWSVGLEISTLGRTVWIVYMGYIKLEGR